MSKIIYDAIAKAGTYKDKQTGEEKVRFHKCGVVFEGDKGLNLKVESLPIGWDGWLSLRTPRPKDAAPAAAPATAAPAKSLEDDDDIPF